MSFRHELIFELRKPPDSSTVMFNDLEGIIEADGCVHFEVCWPTIGRDMSAIAYFRITCEQFETLYELLGCGCVSIDKDGIRLSVALSKILKIIEKAIPSAEVDK